MMASRRPATDRGSSAWLTPVALMAPFYVIGLLVAVQSTSYDFWGGMLIAPVLVAVTVGPITRAARKEGDFSMARLLVLALLLKLVSTAARYAVAFDLYGGRADASGYHDFGVKLASSFRGGNFAADLGPGGGAGTRSLRAITGAIYAVFGSSKFGGFLVFSWLGFLGLFCLYRAFRVAIPEGNHRRYAMLLFFLPSLLFWPSSIGKESWMVFVLGLAAYGAARVFARQRGGLVLIVAGVWGALVVRPHVALIAFVALSVGYLLRRQSANGFGLGVFAKIAGIVALVLVGGLLIARTASFFRVDQLNSGSVEQVLNTTEERSSQGQSAFKPSSARSLRDLPGAIVGVLFRPFPNEAHNTQARVTSLESLLVLGVCLTSWRRLVAVPRLALRIPYVAFSATFLALFVFAFSNVGNFGILARERVQVLPFLLVLLAMPLHSRKEGKKPVPAQ